MSMPFPRRSSSRRVPRQGFSFAELLLAFFFLLVGLVFLFPLFTSSARGTTDVYLETIASTIAVETLEWVLAFSFENLQHPMVQAEIQAKVGLNTFRPVVDFTPAAGGAFTYPPDYRRFERCVEIEIVGRTAVVTVRVRPIERGVSLFRREMITLQRLTAAEYD